MMNRRLIQFLICAIVSLPATAPAEPVPSATLSGRFVLVFTAISANWNAENAAPSIARYDYVRFFKPAK